MLNEAKKAGALVAYCSGQSSATITVCVCVRMNECIQKNRCYTNQKAVFSFNRQMFSDYANFVITYDQNVFN